MDADLPLNPHYGLARARSKLSGLVDLVLSGNVAVIERRGQPVALVDAREHDRLLARNFAFNPQVYFHDDSVAVWLPELSVFGEGADLAEAQTALVDAVLDYVDAWQEDNLKRAPNHEGRAGWVYRAQLAGRPEAIRRMLFSDDETSHLRGASQVLPS